MERLSCFIRDRTWIVTISESDAFLKQQQQYLVRNSFHLLEEEFAWEAAENVSYSIWVSPTLTRFRDTISACLTLFIICSAGNQIFEPSLIDRNSGLFKTAKGRGFLSILSNDCEVDSLKTGKGRAPSTISFRDICHVGQPPFPWTLLCWIQAKKRKLWNEWFQYNLRYNVSAWAEIISPRDILIDQ
jgi:hypothetical protein